MRRLRLELPKHFEFFVDIPVRIGDINYGGHLGNDSILSLVNEARIRFLNQNGFSESNIDGLGLIMVDSVIIYKSQSFYGEILRIEITTDHMNKYGCDFIYRITNKERGKEIARAKTGVAFFDYEKKRIVKIPERFRAAFASD
ncbi:MAG: thioesterase [candidate division Zixibacteria bacterium]|nr:thioesterase [candidate division Zixibacteria bacterium]